MVIATRGCGPSSKRSSVVAMRATNLLAERSPLLPSDDLRRSIAQVRVPSTLASLIPEPRLGTPEI
jgi:hypothetical protein